TCVPREKEEDEDEEEEGIEVMFPLPKTAKGSSPHSTDEATNYASTQIQVSPRVDAHIVSE
ncbi:hypothetical protein LOZ14_001591, partial [Ophidiomyces ophidiicola]